MNQQKHTDIKDFISTDSYKMAYCSLSKFAGQVGLDISTLPFVIKILLENLLRNLDGEKVTMEDIGNLLAYKSVDKDKKEISFFPSRILMQDFTGVPAIVDLAAMRDAAVELNIDPKKINPLIPVDLVIDHSVQVDHFGSKDSFKVNIDLEMKRNMERYGFLKWGQESFQNFKVVPPGEGICHQINLEYLASIVTQTEISAQQFLHFDTLVGTDSHTTMVNGLGVLGWGVGGIGAEAAMLGLPISILVPEVIGFHISGELAAGVTATDLVLTITNLLRKFDVVGKFVEFYGEGLNSLSLYDRVTIANMAPEYGATCGLFPVDEKTLKYMELTGRDLTNIELIEKYSKLQGLWHDINNHKVVYNKTVKLDLADVIPCVAGPKRPQDKIALKLLPETIASLRKNNYEELQNGDIVISAITSCTNTSNPNVLIGAGLLAKKAHELHLKVQPWVKTSLAPGSQVVTDYLNKCGLMKFFELLGFYLVGYGCTTCIGNSGPLPQKIEVQVKEKNLDVAAVLSGNRNFEGRIHPLVKSNYLASPMLCVAFALVGNIGFDFENTALGVDNKNNKIYLKDIWPTAEEIQEVIDNTLERDMFVEKYQQVYQGDEKWRQVGVTKTVNYPWQETSTYVRQPDFFSNKSQANTDTERIDNARILLLLGDSVTTDHISPAGNIPANHSAGKYLIEKSVQQQDFNSFGSRRGNHEVMARGTFANIRIKNKMLDGQEGGYSYYFKDGEEPAFSTVYDAAMQYAKENVPLVVFAGKEYGTGSSRDWAAKGTKLLGVRAVIAASYERIHRSNLIGMGVLPLQLIDTDVDDLKLKGDEYISLSNFSKVQPGGKVDCTIRAANDSKKKIKLLVRIDTQMELSYFLNDGILNYALKKFK